MSLLFLLSRGCAQTTHDFHRLDVFVSLDVTSLPKFSVLPSCSGNSPGPTSRTRSLFRLLFCLRAQSGRPNSNCLIADPRTDDVSPSASSSMAPPDSSK